MSSSDNELLLPPVTEENICLPLSVNAVARYWNYDLPIEEAKDMAKKYPNINGSILIEGIELAERHGLGSKIVHSNLDELKRMIDMGIPPIVIMPGIQDIVQHASVISGYDDKEKTIIHYIPQQSKEGEFQVGVIPDRKFDHLWQEDGRLMVLLAPSDIISEIKVDEDKSKANRLCFVSEKQNIQKNTEDAVSFLTRALELDESNITAMTILAGILNERNSDECVDYYKKAISLNEKCYLAYRGLGNYYLKQKRYDEAEKHYTKAIEINSNRFGPIYKNRGFVRLQQSKNKAAKEDFQEYLNQVPNAKDKKSIEDAIKEL